MHRITLAIAAAVLLLAGTARPASWEAENVDTGGTAKSTSLKVDKEGNVHVAYFVEDGNRYPLKYAFRDHRLKRWFVMTVDQNVGSCTLTLDSKQRPHISYVDYGSGSGARLRYAAWDGTAWKRQPIPLSSDVIAYFTSIVLDAEDRPSISFYEYRGPRDSDFKIRLRNVTWNGQFWQLRTIDAQEGSGKFNSMATDAQGRFHLAYANVSSGTEGIRYGLWDGANWKLDVIEGLTQTRGEVVGYSNTIAVDAAGVPHLAYSNMSDPQLRYATRKNDRWEVQVVDRLANAGYPDRHSIALDAAGNPYISYYDAGRGLLKLARRIGPRWSTEVVDANGGFTSSLAIHEGTVWISFGDRSGSGLKVVRMSIASPTESRLRAPAATTP